VGEFVGLPYLRLCTKSQIVAAFCDDFCAAGQSDAIVVQSPYLTKPYVFMPHETHRKSYEEAALLVAQGELTLTVIAERVDISRQSLCEWRKEPEFRRICTAHREELRGEVRDFGLSQMHNRVKRLQDRARRIDQIVEERALSNEMQGVPGGTTGLLVHDVKGLGSGESAEVVHLYKLDTPLLAEVREIEKQVAQEVGDWVDRTQNENKDSVTVEEINPASVQRVIDMLSMTKDVPALPDPEATEDAGT
jgi:hypothetical protein